MNRSAMIGEIRDGIDSLFAQERFALANEILGSVDRFNFAGVPDATVRRIWREVNGAMLRRDPDYGQGGG